MPVLLNRRHPYLRILDPISGQIVVPAGDPPRPTSFHGGRLTIEEDDPNYALVMDFAQRDPNTVVLTNVVQCHVCGEAFGGQTGRASLAQHIQEVHPLEYLEDMDASALAERNVFIQQRQPFACDLDNQSFPSEAELALHTRTFHGAPVVARDADGTAALPDALRDRLGGESGGEDGGGGVGTVATIPAAKATGGRAAKADA